ncbi:MULTISPECIES: hypothetical protein [unclassified Streptomyces]|uniref:hypothetical protein n=1 Tax=unclassified Streptomyces TaxID=2593676 RepID=UPI00344FFC22
MPYLIADFLLIRAGGEHCPDADAALACGEIASVLGLERVPAKVEGVRSKAARVAERGRPVKEPSGRFTLVPGLRGDGS